MNNYDVILIHPPAIYDFRKKPIFPGPIGHTVCESTEQFIIPPIGMLSIADYLDKNGYRVIVDNIGERMIKDLDFDVEAHISRLSAKIFAIGLNWCVHCQGAIELARLCKKLHPEAIVIMGGLTATVFHEEIIHKSEFVDIVIRGEAEKPFLKLMKTLEGNQTLEDVPNLTFRHTTGKTNINPLMEPVKDLDEFEYTRFDLIEPKGAIFGPGWAPHWTIPVCRGCLHNCVSCGGSAYSYKKYLGRHKPAFRSPAKIAEDIEKLVSQGVGMVFLAQDPNMGGNEYVSKLITALKNLKVKPEEITIEVFRPAGEDFLKKLSKSGLPIVITISPESGVDSIRKIHGRDYTNDEILNFAKLCKKYDIPLGIHTMISLANDTPDTIKKTWKFWELICLTNSRSDNKAPFSYAFGPMILLDPGSPSFDFPDKHGYRLIFKNLEDYVHGMSQLVWPQWISYETRFLDKYSNAELFIDSIEFSINLRGKYGIYTRAEVDDALNRYIKGNREAIDVVKRVMSEVDPDKR